MKRSAGNRNGESNSDSEDNSLVDYEGEQIEPG